MGEGWKQDVAINIDKVNCYNRFCNKMTHSIVTGGE